MTQRWHHYERAFEAYLRAQRIPYVAVDEARKALLPRDQRFVSPHEPGAAAPAPGPGPSLKSFDFVLYADQRNLLMDVKGRKAPRPPQAGAAGARGAGGGRVRRAARLESWVTLDDVESLRTWRTLFGAGFDAGFVFVYWCDEQPPDGLFQEVFAHEDRWYALRAITLSRYAAAMKPRSARWRTVDLPAREFEQLSEPFTPPWVGGGAEVQSSK